MGNNCAPCFDRIHFDFIPYYIKHPCSIVEFIMNNAEADRLATLLEFVFNTYFRDIFSGNLINGAAQVLNSEAKPQRLAGLQN